MLDKFNIIFAVILILVSLNGKSQSSSFNGTIELADVAINDEYMSINILFKNIGEMDFVLYKPTYEDFCNEDIFKVYLVETLNNKRYEVFPCDYISQVVLIHINHKDCVYLKQDEGFIKSYKIKLKDITPFITKGAYSVKVYYNTADVHFESEYDNIFKGKLISNEVIINF